MPDEGGCSWYLWQGWNDKLPYVLELNKNFWNIGRVLILNIFLNIIIVFEVTHLRHPPKMANKWPSHFHHPQKLAIDLLFKIMESANTWQILRTHLPTHFLCRHHKCMFPFWFFKVWSVTCLNANEILNFMKIQSSYLLSSYQRKQASLYFQLYQLLFEHLFGKFMPVTIIYVYYSWQDFVVEM